ncbi:hypothetical protein [Bacillus atrophaeus]|nr:hypothetical protein [Bacillus atrophaeus]
MLARNAKMIVAIGVQKSVEIVLMLVVKLAAANKFSLRIIILG